MKRLKEAFRKKSGKPDTNKPTTPSAVPEPQLYHHIPLGSGGILSREAFSDLLRPATFVGTTRTFDTVGVFFEISDTKCFIAHIDAHVVRFSSSEQPQKKHYNMNYKTTSLLREALIARLDAAVPGERTRRMRDSLVMTCARLSGQEPRAAEAVAKTLREWMGAELSDGGRVAAAGSAFVAGWPAAGDLVFEQAPGEGWAAIECSIGQGAWNLAVKESELETSEEAW
jgi:hypothetical protein